MASPRTISPRMASPPKLDVRIWRGADAGEFVAYEAPSADNQTVLDVVTWIPAPSRAGAGVPVRVPGGGMRLVRDDRERPGAMDVPQPREGRRRRRPAGHRAVAQPAAHQGLGVRPGAVLRQVAARGRALRGRGNTARADARRRSRHGCAARGRRGHRMHQLRGVLPAPATSSGGARTTSVRPRSTAPGRWSTTNGTSRHGKSSTR